MLFSAVIQNRRCSLFFFSLFRKTWLQIQIETFFCRRMLAHKFFQFHKCGLWNGRKLMIVITHIICCVRLFLLCTLNPRRRERCSPLLVSLSDLMTYNNVTKRCDESHEKRDARFQVLSKDLSYWIRRVRMSYFEYSNDGDDDHHNKQTKKKI